MKQNKIRTTITLSAELLARADRIIREGKINSRNNLFAQALEKEIAAIERAEIDSALIEMPQDPEYQQEVMQLETEFASASWEAWQTEEA
ncbi:MAG: CopG family transcriptional regulator [Pleurocapsa sp.]